MESQDRASRFLGETPYWVMFWALWCGVSCKVSVKNKTSKSLKKKKKKKKYISWLQVQRDNLQALILKAAVGWAILPNDH